MTTDYFCLNTCGSRLIPFVLYWKPYHYSGVFCKLSIHFLYIKLKELRFLGHTFLTRSVSSINRYIPPKSNWHFCKMLDHDSTGLFHDRKQLCHTTEIKQGWLKLGTLSSLITLVAFFKKCFWIVATNAIPVTKTRYALECCWSSCDTCIVYK